MISIIICTYNRRASLERTLKSLEKMDKPSHELWEVIVVDNNSTDHTKDCIGEFIQKSTLPLRYVFERQQGKAFALNTGIQSAKGETLLFTDDDVFIDRNWLIQMREAFDQPHCLGVGGKILPVWTTQKPPWFQTDGPYSLMSAVASFDLGDDPCTLTTTTVPFGANVGFKRRAFEKYGLFRRDLGPTADKARIGGGGEDTEFARRLVFGGEKLVYAPKAIVYHPVEQVRTEKRYFQLWYFQYGKTLIRVDSHARDAVSYLGIPRHLFRSLFESSLKWCFAFNPQKRFYYKLQVYLYAGEIVEAYRTSRKSTAQNTGESVGI